MTLTGPETPCGCSSPLICLLPHRYGVSPCGVARWPLFLISTSGVSAPVGQIPLLPSIPPSYNSLRGQLSTGPFPRQWWFRFFHGLRSGFLLYARRPESFTGFVWHRDLSIRLIVLVRPPFRLFFSHPAFFSFPQKPFCPFFFFLPLRENCPCY